MVWVSSTRIIVTSSLSPDEKRERERTTSTFHLFGPLICLCDLPTDTNCKNAILWKSAVSHNATLWKYTTQFQLTCYPLIFSFPSPLSPSLSRLGAFVCRALVNESFSSAPRTNQRIRVYAMRGNVNWDISIQGNSVSYVIGVTVDMTSCILGMLLYILHFQFPWPIISIRLFAKVFRFSSTKRIHTHTHAIRHERVRQ